MYALNQDLARRRLLYPRPLATLPNILVIDIPERFASASLPLGRFYPIIVETEREQRELDGYLAAPRPEPVVPELLDHRPSQLDAERISIATYDPPAPGWPFVLLCHWSRTYTSIVSDPRLFARGAYTTEMFDTLDALNSASERLLTVLSTGSPVDVMLVPNQARFIGHA